MTTSTKLSVVAAFLLSTTSLLGATSTASAHCPPPGPPNKIHIFCVHVVNVNEPKIWGGGSLGYNAGQDSALQNTRHYPYGPDPLKGRYEVAVWCPVCVPEWSRHRYGNW